MANLMLNDAARVALAVLLNSLWQGALIALIAWGVLRIFSRANAATRYAIWALALAAMIVTPIFTSLPHVSVEAPPAHTAWMQPASTSSSTNASAPAQAAAAHHDVARSSPFPLSLSVPQFKIPTVFALAVFVVWSLAALVVLGRLILAIVSLEKLKRDSLPLDVAYRDQMPEWNAAIKGFRDVRICVSDAIEVPVAIGLFDAMILLPRGLVTSLDPKEIDQIALHELGHLRRNDDWTNALQRIACSFMFFNPAAWFVSRQLDLEREVACDDYVLRTTGAARSYAFCLTRIAEVTSWPQRGVAAPGVFITRRNISIRIERLLRSGRTIGSSIAPEIAATVAVALVLVSVLLRTMTPSVAYTLPAAKDKDEMTAPLIVKVIEQPPKVKATVTDAQAAHLQKVKADVPAMPALPKVAPMPLMQKVAELPSTPDVRKIANDASRAATDAETAGTDIGTAIGSSVATAVSSAVAKAVGAQDLQDMCTGCDYSDSDMHGHDFAHKSLNGANFSGTNLRGANFDHASLTGVNFESADLRDASFDHADLMGCNLDGARLSGARFDHARLTGCNVDAQNLSPQQAREFLVSCMGCNFDGANLRGMDLRNLHINGANLDGADLRGADLSGSKFMGVNFANVKLDGAKLDGAKFYGCNFSGVDFHNVDVSKATFFGSSRRDVQQHSFLQSPTGHGRARISRCDADTYAPA